MAAKATLIYIIFVFFVTSDCAPKKTKIRDHIPHTVYDQQQTGDYNIQLHLKDFQIIAVLRDDAGSLGDYDYSYDYSDFTIKPSSQKPTESSSEPSSSTFKPPTSVSTTRPPYHPYPFVTSSTTEKPISTLKPNTTEPSSTTKKPVATDNQVSEEKPLPVQQSSLIEQSSSTQPDKITESSTVSDVSSTVPVSNISTTQKSLKLDDSGSPGKIKVQIIETPVRMQIVPGEEIEQDETLPPGEILQLRRCAVGFTRDKRGRCRRVRRPGYVKSSISSGFNRLANNLASKLRQSSEENSGSSESKED